MKSSFDRDYYENGIQAGVSCYENYRWLPDLTLPMAQAMVAHLGLSEADTILDFGCAKGFVVKALRIMGLNAYGVDVSEYAIAQADESTKKFIRVIQPGVVPYEDGGLPWSCIIAKDVFEHLTEDEAKTALRSFSNLTNKLFVVVPLGDGERYVIPEMEKDVTHKIRQPAEWWMDRITQAGFRNVAFSYAVPGIKENWTSRYPKGNGFFIAE